MTNAKTVTVVLPARDMGATIADALAGLREQDFAGEWEVIVVDDASTDDTREVANRELPSLPGGRLLSAHGRGAGPARNLGSAHARGDLLAFCDADDVPARGWLRALESAARDAEIAVGSFRFDALNPTWVRTAHSLPERYDAPFVGHGFLPFASGGNAAYRRDSFTRFGGFDEGFRHAQDMELSWRMQLGGCRLAFAPDAVVQMRLRATSRGMLRQHSRWGAANARLYARYRRQGMPPSDLRAAFREWRRLVAQAPVAGLSRRRRAEWVRRAGLRAGQLAGSVKHGVLFP